MDTYESVYKAYYETKQELEEKYKEIKKLKTKPKVNLEDCMQSERILSRAIEESINIVFITDFKGNIEYVNPMFEEVTGYSKDVVLGQNPRILASGETPFHAYQELWETISSGITWRGVFKNKKINGEFYWVKGLISPIKDDSGKITHFLAIQENITERIMAEKKAQAMLRLDLVTGILNRKYFLDCVESDLISKNPGVLILFDVDRFKLINDTYGHSIGDAFLKRIIEQILHILDHELKMSLYCIGRFGEDEIILWFREINGLNGLEIAERIRKAVENYRFTEHNISTTISAGIVAMPQHGLTVNDLLIRLDSSLFQAKERGKNKCVLYQPEDHHFESFQRRLHQKDRIEKALNEDRFEIWFQPILDLKTNSIDHFEVLARMRDEQGKIILPGAFIPAAENFGLINQLSRVIADKTIQYQANLQKQGKLYTFSMNLSGKDMDNDTLLDFLKEKFCQYQANPSCFVFEITETAAIRDMNAAVKCVQALKKMGCRFSLDDFGVGFTSFIYLKELQVDYVKIDGIFIKKLPEQVQDQGIVKAIQTIASSMNIQTIAEFVENDKILLLLKIFQIDYAQGYFIGHPAPEPKADFQMKV
ncbi:MAG: EAL domain-containing protein [Desulfobacterales bacterium]|nr:EAL domain-containing protein [Desulfobacterales bacterium]